MGGGRYPRDQVPSQYLAELRRIMSNELRRRGITPLSDVQMDNCIKAVAVIVVFIFLLAIVVIRFMILSNNG